MKRAELVLKTKSEHPGVVETLTAAGVLPCHELRYAELWAEYQRLIENKSKEEARSILVQETKLKRGTVIAIIRRMDSPIF